MKKNFCVYTVIASATISFGFTSMAEAAPEEKDVVETIEEVIGSITVNKKGEAFGEKTFTSTDDKKVNEKYESWVGKIKEMGLVMDSEIIEITKKTFVEELEDKNLTELLKRKGE